MTNYEKIKSMSIDEMAKLIHKLDDLPMCNHCLGLCMKDDVKPDKNGCIPVELCERGIKQWLESECDEVKLHEIKIDYKFALQKANGIKDFEIRDNFTLFLAIITFLQTKPMPKSIYKICWRNRAND